MLKLNKVSKSFNLSDEKVLKVYDELDLHLNEGDFLTVIGANGSGKSTLINLITAFHSVDSGEILLAGNPIQDLKSHEIFKLIACVYQDPNKGVSESLTVKENLLLAKNKGKLFNLSLLNSKSDEQEIKNILKGAPLNLKNHMDLKVKNLSGGQRQVLSLLMSVIDKPKLLLLDEHTAALDPKNSDLLMKFTDKLLRENKITSIMITHKLEDAYKYGNKLVMFDKGKISLYINKDKDQCPSIDDLREVFNL